jgi:hypothetical protein
MEKTEIISEQEKTMIYTGLPSTLSCKKINQKHRSNLDWDLRDIDVFKACVSFTIVMIMILTVAIVLTKLTHDAQVEGDYVRILNKGGSDQRN